MKIFGSKTNAYEETILDLHLPCKSEDDEKILYKIIELKHKLSTNFLLSSNVEYAIVKKYEDKMHERLDFLDAAMRIEKENVQQAISMYETLIAEGYAYTANPYQRLAILYRKAKCYDDEIRVIKSGLRALVGSDLDLFYAEFIDRLEKAVILRERNK